MHHAFCSLFSYTHQQMHLYTGSVKKMCTHFKRCYLCITFQSWIELRLQCVVGRTLKRDLYSSFCCRYKLSITILIQFFLSYNVYMFFWQPLYIYKIFKIYFKTLKMLLHVSIILREHTLFLAKIIVWSKHVVAF